MTEFDVKQLRPNLTPAQVFWRFFLLGPIFGALVQLFLLNVLLLIIFLSNPRAPPPSSDGAAILMWIFAYTEISGAMEAILVFFFGLPASFLVAVCAMCSYMAFRRVNFVVVLAAALAAILLENIVAADAYTGYFATHGVRGPWTPDLPDEWSPDLRAAALLGVLLHFVSVSICWWLVRRERLPPLMT